MMSRYLKVLLVLAFANLLLTLATAIWHDWIEIVFGVDPDGGNGVLEWLIAAAFASFSLVFGTLAGIEWRRCRSAANY